MDLFGEFGLDGSTTPAPDVMGNVQEIIGSGTIENANKTIASLRNFVIGIVGIAILLVIMSFVIKKMRNSRSR